MALQADTLGSSLWPGLIHISIVAKKMWDHNWPGTTPILELVHKNREYGRTGPQRKKIKYFVLHLFSGDLSDEIEGYGDSVSSRPLFS